MKDKKVLFLVHAAAIAAIYVVLTLVFAPFSFGEIQVRVSEALTILPYFTPAAIPGLFVGCLIGNTVGGAIPIDIICGSLATLIGAFITYRLRRHRMLAPGRTDRSQYADRTVRPPLRLQRSAADPVYDAYCRYRRSDLLRSDRHDRTDRAGTLQRNSF